MIALSMENPDQNFLILVAGTGDLQVQKDLLALHPRRALTNVDVLSFGVWLIGCLMNCIRKS